MVEIITKSANETKKTAVNLAKEIKKQIFLKHALIIAIEGNLGSGKTTFIQGLAEGLGVKENVLSPTFLILKEFPISIRQNQFKYFYHIDAYRPKNPNEILELGFKDLEGNPENIIAIEWADKIKEILPKNVLWIDFENLGGDKRKIIIDF